MGKGKRTRGGGQGADGDLGRETEIPDAFWADLDPDGSMSERPDYWTDLGPPEPPTRLAWLRHRLRQAAALVGVQTPDPWSSPHVPQAEWTRLSEEALGPLLKAGDYADRKQARSSAPNARTTARKPAAYSPEEMPQLPQSHDTKSALGALRRTLKVDA